MTSCKEYTKSNTITVDVVSPYRPNQDSVELTELIRQVYEWRETKRIADFPYKYDDKQDSIFIGIDWDKYQENVRIFKETNLFTDDFKIKHKEIALTLDSSIRQADIKWRNINDGIPIWDSGADDWCGCQDNPDNYWNFLTIDNLTVNKEYAKFKWSWSKEYEGRYNVTAKKVDGRWKINTLEWFNNYSSVDQYNKIMKE